jgi:hypothetical protein
MLRNERESERVGSIEFPAETFAVQAWIIRQSSINYSQTTNRPIKVFILEVCWSTLLLWIRCEHLAIG